MLCNVFLVLFGAVHKPLSHVCLVHCLENQNDLFCEVALYRVYVCVRACVCVRVCLTN